MTHSFFERSTREFLDFPKGASTVIQSWKTADRLHNRLELALAGALLLLLAGLGSSPAKDVYIAQVSQGANTGADAASAHSITWFNTAANWGGGTTQIAAGDTVHLCGTITNVLTVQASGMAGNITTILFEPNARFSMPTIPDTGGIALGSFNYLKVDGGVNGTMECTANGSGMGQTGSCAIKGNPTIGNITIQNLTIQNLYVRTNNQDSIASTGVYIYPWSSVSSNLSVFNCTFTWCEQGVAIAYGLNVFNVQVISNSFENINHGTVFASANTGSHLTGAVWAWNRANHFGSWSNPGANLFHHNGFYAWADAVGASITNIYITNNIVGGDFGVQDYVTAGIYLSSNTGDGVWNALIADNLVSFTNGGASSGALYLMNVKNSLVANNTIADVTGNHISMQLYPTCSGITLSNNIFTGAGICYYFYPSGLVLPLASDKNVFFTSGTIAMDTNYLGFAQWQAQGYDAHSLTNDPLFVSAATGNFSLQSNSPAIGAGANLYPRASTDASGLGRSATGPWTIGAFEATIKQPPVTNQVPLPPRTMISLTVNQISPLTVQTSGSANVGAGSLYDFGDGVTSSIASPMHTYATAGTYTVTRTITNSSGAVVSAKAVITVSQ